MTLGIVEVSQVCTSMRALNLDLFAELGAWATQAEPGASQRWFATACHRHAWHAELWADRSPTIPGHDRDAAVAAERTRRLPTDVDAIAYLDLLRSLTRTLDQIALGIDDDLDPSTRRVVTVVGNDVAELTFDSSSS